MENVFNVRYDAKLDKLEIPKDKWKDRMCKFIRKNKFISLVFSCFVALAGINFYLIFSFMRILESF